MKTALIAVASVLALSACGSRSREGAALAGPEPVVPVAEVIATPAPVAVKPPILLLHGLGGFSQVGDLEYFNGVKEALEADGWTVSAPALDPLQAMEVRGVEVAAAIDAALAASGASSVVIIAHSQGGLDARYAISTLGYGDRIAALATIGTPHHGSKTADLAIGLIPGDAGAAAAAIVNAIFGAIIPNPQDSQAAIVEMSEARTDGVFNPANPDDARVRYYSIAGTTQPFDDVDHTTTDVVGPLLMPSWWIEKGLEGDNDGIVALSSAHWGTYLGTIPADHMDEINLPNAASHPAFDAIRFYRALAAFLEKTGPAPL